MSQQVVHSDVFLSSSCDEVRVAIVMFFFDVLPTGLEL